MRILPSCSHISTTVWIHHLDFHETPGEKVTWNYTKILQAVFNKYSKQYPTTQQLYGHLPLISQIIQER